MGKRGLLLQEPTPAAQSITNTACVSRIAALRSRKYQGQELHEGAARVDKKTDARQFFGLLRRAARGALRRQRCHTGESDCNCQDDGSGIHVISRESKLAVTLR